MFKIELGRSTTIEIKGITTIALQEVGPGLHVQQGILCRGENDLIILSDPHGGTGGRCIGEKCGDHAPDDEARTGLEGRDDIRTWDKGPGVDDLWRPLGNGKDPPLHAAEGIELLALLDHET